MIKFAFGKSLIYLSVYKTIYYLRSIEMTQVQNHFSFSAPLFQTFLMALGEIIGGISVYLFINKAFKKKESKGFKYLGIQLRLMKSKDDVRRDSWTKIILLVFFNGFFDFTEFIILNSVVIQYTDMSSSINHRFSTITTIASSLLCTYVLKFKIRRHQKVILVLISVVFVINFFIEFAYSPKNADFFKVFFLNILNVLLITYMDIVERYLGDYDFSNPFGILAGEGFFVLILTGLYSIGKDPFGPMKLLYEEFDAGKYILLVFLLFLYVILSAALNIYKVHCNVFFSPVARSLTDYLFNPIYLIYSYFVDDDFKYKGEQNLLFFLLNEFISFIVIFLGFIYNEYIILSCCGLEHETTHHIGIRARLNSLPNSNQYENNSDDEDSDDDKHEDNDKEEADK